MNTELLDSIRESVSRHAGSCCAAADEIWDHPEINFHENHSAGVLKNLLASAGFRITENLDGMPTAFRAEYGSGSPVIGFLGEFDALAAMSQKSDCAVREAESAGAPGHGCGHNLLGTGSACAAIAVRDLIARGILSGTVVFLGCPAEETGSAKAFLARDGYLNGFDAFLSWHPWDVCGLWPGSSLANVKLIFHFTGQSAHAAGSPHLGRSALDALEIMNVGVQFLREHVPEDTRIHYAITDAGGSAPNVVQAHAEAVYLVRSPRLDDLRNIYARVIDCAKGAALMTGTKVDVEFVKGCSNILPNHTIESELQRCMNAVGIPEYDPEDLQLAESLHASLESPENTLAKIARFASPAERAGLLSHSGESLYRFITPEVNVDTPVLSISSDVGDASWCAPTSQILAAAWAADTPAHSWQAVSIGKSAAAHKAMLFASSVLGLCGARLMSDPALLSAAHAEFEASVTAAPYVCPVPADVHPKF